MASSTLIERIIAWRGTSAQVKLYFRKMRDGEIPQSTDNMASFEGAMFALDAQASELLEEAARLVKETADVVAGALELIDNAEAQDRFPNEADLEEFLASARQHRMEARQLDPTPVYVPNEDRGFLADMVKPAGKGNIVLFTGVRQSNGGRS